MLTRHYPVSQIGAVCIWWHSAWRGSSFYFSWTFCFVREFWGVLSCENLKRELKREFKVGQCLTHLWLIWFTIYIYVHFKSSTAIRYFFWLRVCACFEQFLFLTAAWYSFLKLISSWCLFRVYWVANGRWSELVFIGLLNNRLVLFSISVDCWFIPDWIDLETNHYRYIKGKNSVVRMLKTHSATRHQTY